MKLDGVVAEVANAFQKNRSAIANLVERSAPLRPVDRAVAGRLMRILPAVVVVDVSRRQQTSRRPVSLQPVMP